MEGEEIFCMPLAEEYNTVSHTRSRGSGEDITGVKEGACVVIDQEAPIFSPLLSSGQF